jgi:hypothetical protein
MSRLLVRAAVTVMPGPTVIWSVSDPAVISTVLRAWAMPTWIFCPPIMIAPRAETRRVTVSGSGRRPGRAGSGRREAGQVSGVEPGRQGLDAVAAEQT